MKGRLEAAVLALAASGCATAIDADTAMNRPPPSLERALRALRAGDSCANDWRMNRSSATPVEKGGYVENCAPVFPEVLQQAGIQGACRSMFDLTDDGQAVNVESRCATEVHGEAPYTDEWRGFAEALLAASTDRSLDFWRTDMAAYDPNASRSNVSKVTHFRFSDDVRPAPELVPEPFDRTAQ